MNATIGAKKGMTQIFDQDGKAIPVTLIQIGDVRVVEEQKLNEELKVVVIGAGKKSKPTKALAGKYSQNVPTFTTSFPCPVGQTEFNFGADTFTIGDKVKVSGVTKGKGFQGVVKRWNFAGGPKTHGQSDKHRHPGSIGQRMTPGRVYKGMKMGGHMGNKTATFLNLQVVDIDTENNLIALRGQVPGSNGSFVIISK